mmetsp:Transcript_27993/g.69900  ORF Transcript_27993/g.69900 Transcript_27993/m.69900 type:complete len:363 (-) Transcript_27993:384-1472(-)
MGAVGVGLRRLVGLPVVRCGGGGRGRVIGGERRQLRERLDGSSDERAVLLVCGVLDVNAGRVGLQDGYELPHGVPVEGALPLDVVPHLRPGHLALEECYAAQHGGVDVVAQLLRQPLVEVEVLTLVGQVDELKEERRRARLHQHRVEARTHLVAHVEQLPQAPGVPRPHVVEDDREVPGEVCGHPPLHRLGVAVGLREVLGHQLVQQPLTHRREGLRLLHVQQAHQQQLRAVALRVAAEVTHLLVPLGLANVQQRPQQLGAGPRPVGPAIGHGRPLHTVHWRQQRGGVCEGEDLWGGVDGVAEEVQLRLLVLPGAADDDLQGEGGALGRLLVDGHNQVEGVLVGQPQLGCVEALPHRQAAAG